MQMSFVSCREFMFLPALNCLSVRHAQCMACSLLSITIPESEMKNIVRIALLSALAGFAVVGQAQQTTGAESGSCGYSIGLSCPDISGIPDFCPSTCGIGTYAGACTIQGAGGWVTCYYPQ
jgi:hypothetical protein